MANIKFSALPSADQVFGDKKIALSSGNVASTYLRTLAVKVKKTDTVIFDDNTMSDDDTLFFPLLIDKAYSWYHWVQVVGTTNSNIKFQYTIPTNATGFRHDIYYDVASFKKGVNITTARSCGIESTTIAGNFCQGTIQMGDTAGNLQLQWAQNVSHADTLTMKAGSRFVVWEESP